MKFSTSSVPGRLVLLESLADTHAFGVALGQHCFPGTCIGLIGGLGAGKTHLTRAIGEGLGVANPQAITSPTFTLVHEYPGRLPLFHFDTYRLESLDDFLNLGPQEYYQAGGVCVIEWADKVLDALPDDCLLIEITPGEAEERTLNLIPRDPAHAQVVESFWE